MRVELTLGIALAGIPIGLGACRSSAPKGGVAAKASASSAPTASASVAIRSRISPLVGSTIMRVTPEGGLERATSRPGRPIQEIPDPHWAREAIPTVTADESFVFVQDLGGWDGPTHTTTIDGSRRVRHVYTYEEVEGGKLVRRGREVRFELTAGELDELVRTLNRERFLALAMKYDSGDSDGGWWIFEVRTGGKSKFVTAKNTYPGPLVRIATFVKERIIDARPELEAKSGLLSGLPSSLGRQERYAGCDPKVGLEGPLADGVCMLRTFTVRLHAHPSLPPGASYQVSVFDRSAKNALVTREKGTFGNFRAREVDVELTLERTFELDEGHRYEAEVEVTKDGRVTHRAAAPIFTYGAPDAVELQLVPSEPL